MVGLLNAFFLEVILISTAIITLLIEAILNISIDLQILVIPRHLVF